MAVFTFEQQNEIRQHVAEEADRRFRRYVDIAQRYLAHLIQRRFFWDAPPAVRWAHYVMNPPVLPDGTPTPADETGAWDYAAIQDQLPWLFERFVRDWAAMAREGLKEEMNE